MSFRRVLVPLVVAGASLVIGTTPAFAAGPPGARRVHLRSGHRRADVRRHDNE